MFSLLSVFSGFFLWAGEPLPCRISTTGNQPVLCQGMPLFLNIQADGNEGLFSNLKWQTNGNFLSDPDKLFVRLDTGTPGIYKVSFSASNNFGDTTHCEILIEVLAQPNVKIVENFSPFRRFLFKKPMPRLLIIPLENYIFQWFLNDVEIQGANTVRYKPRNPGKYYVKAVSPQGCTAFSNTIIVD